MYAECVKYYYAPTVVRKIPNYKMGKTPDWHFAEEDMKMSSKHVK